MRVGIFEYWPILHTGHGQHSLLVHFARMQISQVMSLPGCEATISLEIVTFRQVVIAIAQFLLACRTRANRFEYSLSNYSAITQLNA